MLCDTRGYFATCCIVSSAGPYPDAVERQRNLTGLQNRDLGVQIPCRPFSDEASSLPDMSTVVIPENIAEHDGPESGRREPNVAVPSLALDKVPSLQGKASGNTAAMSQMSKPDSESEAAPPLAEIRPRPDTLTSEQVAALDGAAPLLVNQAPQEVQDRLIQLSGWSRGCGS